MKSELPRTTLSIVAAFILLIFSCVSINAQIENKLGLRFYGSFLYTEKVPNALFFFSDIEKNDSFELRKALRNHDIDTLVLSSKGGSVWERLKHGGHHFDKKLTTYIPKLGLEGEGTCESACAYMFFGGSTRIADGKLGVHQFYSGSASESAKIGTTQKVAQFTVSEIIGYLNEFKTPPFVYERMFQQSEMYYFNDNEMSRIVRVENTFSEEEKLKVSQFISNFKTELMLLKNKNDANASKKSQPAPKTTVTEKTIAPKVIEKNPISEKDLVKNIQKKLNRLNCKAGLADGIIGNQTRLALSRYASAAGRNINVSVLKLESFLTELKRTTVRCKKITKANLICDRPIPAKRFNDLGIKKIIISDYFQRKENSSVHKIEYCTDSRCFEELHGFVPGPKFVSIRPNFGKIFITLDKRPETGPQGILYIFREGDRYTPKRLQSRFDVDKCRQ